MRRKETSKKKRRVGETGFAMNGDTLSQRNFEMSRIANVLKNIEESSKRK